MNPEEEDQRIAAWHQIAGHPFFKPAYDTDGPLIDAMAKHLDSMNDAIVIRREDHQFESTAAAESVVRAHAGITRDRAHRPLTADDLDRVVANAEFVISAVEHLREHPPVDEALKSDLEAAFHAGEYGATKVAAFLAERGWTKKTFAEQFNEHFTTGPGAAS